MSLIPLLFSAWWADLDRPHRLMDQNFGMGLYPSQLLVPDALDRLYSPLSNRQLELYYRPLAELVRRGEGGSSTITADKDMFKVILDVQQFKPEEINVKLIDRFVVVEAKHEEKRDEHGFISRQFVRRYLLPEQVDEAQLSSNISSDGVLTIMAPLKPEEKKSNERTIKIEFTGKPAIRPDGEKRTAESTTAEGSAEETTTQESTTQDSTTKAKPDKKKKK